MNSKHILSSNAFWTLNKKLTQELKDVQSTLFLTYLVDKEDFHRTNGTLKIKEGKEWFFATSAKIEEVTTLTYKQQKRCIKILKDKELISYILLGVPAKLHFNLSHNKICHLILSSIDKRAIQELPNGQNIIERTEEEEQNKRTEKEKQIDVVLLFFKEQTGKGISIKGVRAQVNRDLVRKVLNLKEKPSIEEVKNVIELKYLEWNWNPEMNKNIQISTIFRKINFLKYLEQVTILEDPEEKEKFLNGINQQKKKYETNSNGKLASVNQAKEKSGVGEIDSEFGI